MPTQCDFLITNDLLTINYFKKRRLKSGVPQEGVLSPTLFIYLTTFGGGFGKSTKTTTKRSVLYAYDMNTMMSHNIIQTAENNLQPYLNDLFTWTEINELQLNSS